MGLPTQLFHFFSVFLFFLCYFIKVDDKTIAKINDPTFHHTVCEHVSNGGSLTELCQTLQIRYNKIISWIYSNEARASDYEKALAARGEWFIQTVLSELRDIATADIRQAYSKDGTLLPVDEWPPALARVVSAVETEEIFDGRGDERTMIGYTKRLKMWDKLRALELLGKNMRMFKEQVEHTGTLSLEELVMGSMETVKEITDGRTQGQGAEQGSIPAA